MDTRKAVFAGSWYPGTAGACEQAIAEFLDWQPDQALTIGPVLGGIVPHAGWVYSGRIACNVIDCLKEDPPPDIVVIFGMHMHPNSTNTMMDRGSWETPFGPLPVAEDLAKDLNRHFSFQLETPQRFAQDNTIELQMPFVKFLLSPTAVLAIGVAPRGASLEIGQAIADWARKHDKRLKVIGSTDLTHYGSNYGFTSHGSGRTALDWVRQNNDRRLIDALLRMEPRQVIKEGLEHMNACCAGAAATALATVCQMGAKNAQLIDYATSYDINPAESFVGYAGVVFG